MTDLIALAALWLLSRCRGAGGGEYEPELSPVPATPGGSPGWPGSPIALPASTPPWPQVVPSDLPPFPGTSWEFDEPPPPAVQARARQLVDQLWKQGSGAFRVERTDGRWISYQAQVVASGRKGVVAYRIRPSSSRPPAAPSFSGTTASRTTRPAAPRVATRAPTRAAPARPAPAPARPPAAVPSAPPAAAAPVSQLQLPTLRRGAGIRPQAPNADVRLLQQRLGIPADGQFGGGTEQAVKDFQRRNGLGIDGIVGQQTWRALFGQELRV